MKLQYKEYKVLDVDISELFMLAITEEDKFSMATIEDIEEMKFKDFMDELDEILKSGRIVDLFNTLIRNKLKKIILKLILDSDDLIVYEFWYNKRYTQEEIGRLLGVTRQAIHKRIKKIDKKLEEVGRLFQEDLEI